MSLYRINSIVYPSYILINRYASIPIHIDEHIIVCHLRHLLLLDKLEHNCYEQ